MTHIHDTDALDQLRKGLRIEPDHVRRMRNVFYKKHRPAAEALAQLPAEQRTAFTREVAFHSLSLHSRHDSQLDGASKLLFRTAAGRLIESVLLRIASGRTSVCVSSQVGCAVRCRFCATGQMGLAENLTSAEILDQVIQANLELQGEGRAIRNVVFMGMGEPLLNEGEVHKAVEVLLAPQCFDLSPARVLVSTVGIPDAMCRFAERFPRVGMALSLHSARQRQREDLIPLARRYPLDVLRQAILHITRVQQQPLMIEYLMLAGLNDTDEDLAHLREYLEGQRVHINLIPFNAISGETGLTGTDLQRQRAFAAALTEAGFTVTVRYSLGSDIAAACGQLARQQMAPAGNQGAEVKL